MRPTSARATSSFDCGGHDSTPLAVTRCTVLTSPPITPLSDDTSLATIQSQPLRLSLSLALATRFSVSAAKPMTSRGRLVLRCAMVARMSGFSTSDSAGVPAFRLLDLFAIWRRRRASPRPRPRRPRNPPASPSRPRRASAAPISTLMILHADGIGNVDRSRHQHDVGAGRCGRCGDGVALLAGRAVGDVAHRIDRLVRRPRGDDDALAGERALAGVRRRAASPPRRRSPPAPPCGRCRLRRAPPSRRHWARRSRRRRRPVARDCAASPCAPTSSGSSPARSGSACRWRAAPRWRDRRRGRPPSSPSGRRWRARRRRDRCRARAGCGRRRIRFRIEQVGEHLPARERAGGERRDELLRRLGEDAAHGRRRDPAAGG